MYGTFSLHGDGLEPAASEWACGLAGMADRFWQDGLLVLGHHLVCETDTHRMHTDTACQATKDEAQMHPQI